MKCPKNVKENISKNMCACGKYRLPLERQTLQSSYDAQLQQCQVVYEGKVSAERSVLHTNTYVKLKVSHFI